MDSGNGTSEATAKPPGSLGSPRSPGSFDTSSIPHEDATPLSDPDVPTWVESSRHNPDAAPDLNTAEYGESSISSSSVLSGYSSSQSSSIIPPDMLNSTLFDASVFGQYSQNPLPIGVEEAPQLRQGTPEISLDEDTMSGSWDVSSPSTASGSTDYQSDSQNSDVSQEMASTRLPCILTIAGHCDRSFSLGRESVWTAHIGRHFHNKYPPSCQCKFCGQKFDSSQPFPIEPWNSEDFGSNGETNGRNEAIFQRFLRHIAGHYENSKISGLWNPGFDVLRFMRSRRLIDSDEFHDLIQPPSGWGGTTQNDLYPVGIDQSNAYLTLEYNEGEY